ncbi:MAG: hypothetical protein N5P05_003654 [Chroococcopsis gigantea SAG 12.99]|jgi:GTPase Era involved in 16S rRNA processing|nr:hypothetical protein [Chroococcopsis gigantea SAG 12.99]
MTDNLYQTFAEVQANAESLANYWKNFYQEIARHLPDTYGAEIAELNSKLDGALERLTYELHHPTLTIATTGTTSSGKSTLVNLLCGAEIVPVAVSEMSAGVVTVEYGERKSLTVQETPGAQWPCGEWHDITEDEIYQRLDEVMNSYIDNRGKGFGLACPQSMITYPFRLLKDIDLQLPPGAKVRIMDLPGLAYVGDEGNATVIRQCREALCLVTYNSAETDPQKVRNLLQEVVGQVKDLGGSPARMLFILNKIDVFRADRNWPETEYRFVEKTVNSIKTELTERLKEHTQAIENLQVIKLSTWPALLALQIRETKETLQDVLDDLPKNQQDWSSRDRVRFGKANLGLNACKKVDENFNFLIDENILDELPRRHEKWSTHDRTRVAESLSKKSYGEEFQDSLRSHINKHFPQLVIPQIIDKFHTSAGNAVAEWAVQTTQAILKSSEEEYKRECERIVDIRLSLQRFLKLNHQKLREPFEKIDANLKKFIDGEPEEDPIVFIETQINQLTDIPPYDTLKDVLFPIYGWRNELAQAIERVLTTVAQSIASGQVQIEDTNLKKANQRYVNLLENNLRRIIHLGYTSTIAKNGKKIEAKTDQEKNNLNNLNHELNELGIHLSLIMEDVLEQVCEQELNRTHEAIEQLFHCHLNFLELGVNEIAPHLAIKFPQSQLVQIGTQPQINFKFKTGFAIIPGTWQETVQVAVRKRVFWKLFLGKATFYETKYETRSSDNANLPKIVELLSNWMFQAKSFEPELVKQVNGWLLKEIEQLQKNVNVIQSEVIERYQERLDRANQEVIVNYEDTKNVWEPLEKQARELKENFNNFIIFNIREV